MKYVFEKTKEMMKDLGENYNLFCRLVLTSHHNGIIGKVICRLYGKKSEYLETLIINFIGEIADNIQSLSEAEKKIVIDKINASEISAAYKFGIYTELIKSKRNLIKLIDVNSIPSTHFLALCGMFKEDDIDYLIDVVIDQKMKTKWKY